MQGSCIEDTSSAVRTLEDLHPHYELLFLAQNSLDETPLVPSIYRGVVASIDLENRFEQLAHICVAADTTEHDSGKLGTFASVETLL